MPSRESLAAIERAVSECRACPRLVEHRERSAAAPPRRFVSASYWARAVPSFGHRKPRLLVVGLAPAAHGANRTGRMFTGDRSGDWLFEALHRYGFASQPTSRDRSDGLSLEDAYITAIAHCAPPGNKPTRSEVEACRGYLVRELGAMPRLEVVLALGKIGFDGFLAAWSESGGVVPTPRPKFAHGARVRLPDGPWLLSSYHPSQQNTFTGRLTRPMFHRVFRAARSLVEA